MKCTRALKVRFYKSKSYLTGELYFVYTEKNWIPRIQHRDRPASAGKALNRN
jgi:hypothetical protein